MLDALSALIQNAALLLAMMVVFDLISDRKTLYGHGPQQITAGLILGGLCLGLMHSSFPLAPGLLFDTRSVLLSLSGLFFGGIPTILAMAMAATYRLLQGGDGAWTGVAVILAAGGIGILFRHFRRERLENIRLRELFAFGAVVHLVMLALMLTLPEEKARPVLREIAWPVMLVCSPATAALGRLLAKRLLREGATEFLTGSEELFRNLFQKHAAVKLLIDLEDGRIVDANEAAVEFYGWSLDELRRMTIAEINVLSASQMEAEMEDARKSGRIHLTLRHRRADGSVRDVSVYSSRVQSSGKVLLHSIVHDITDGKRALDTLRESEAYQREILQTTTDGFWVLDRKGRVVEANDAYCALSGYSREELLTLGINDLDAEEKPEDTRRRIERIIAKGSEVFEASHRRKDGTVFPVEINTSYLNQRGGQFICFCRDLTRRKLTEEALKHEHAMLARTEAIAHVGSWEWDAGADKVTWSDELFRIFGLEPAEVAPPFAEHQSFYVPEDRARLARAVQECVDNGVPYDLEVRVVRPDGESRHCVVRGFPERRADGTIARLYGSLHDVTEIKRAEERITTLSYMLDDAPAAITIHDTVGRFVFANAATASLHGYDGPDEFMRINLHDLDVPESEALLADRLETIEEEGEARFEVEHYRKDGSIFPVSVLAKRIEWEGKPAVLSIAADITERRIAEDRLRNSYNLLRNLSALVPGVIYQYRIFPDGRSCFPYSSPGIWKIYEVTPEEVEQDATPVFGRLHREDAGRVAEAIAESARTLETFRCEFRVVLPEQGLRWRWSQAEPQRTEDGGTLWHGIILDITERMQAEEELRHSHELMRYIVEHTNSAIAVHDRDLRYVFVSQRYLDDFKVRERDIVGKHHYDVFPDLPEKWREVHRKALAGEVSGSERDPYEKSDGTVEWTRWKCRPWFEMDGTIGGIIVYTEVITERVRAEEALAEQQALLTAIYRNAPLVLMLVDDDRRVRQVNGFAAEFADRTVQEMLGVPCGEALRCIHALDDPRGCGFGEHCRECVIRNTVVDTLETGRTHLQVEAPYSLLHDGRIREITFLLSTTPLMVKKARMALVTLQDITSHKQAEGERERLQAQLNQSQKMESVGRLAGGVAHDFNNMLNVILGHSELALDDLPEGSPLRDYLEEIRKAAQRSAGLTQQLLAFARKQTVSPKTLDLNETISSMLKMLERLIGEDIDLLWKPGGRLNLVHIDPGQVDQVLANLAVNARDAIGHRNGKITIETSNVCFDEDYCTDHAGFTPGDFVMLAVSDDGCGMDEDTYAQMFEPFFTTKEIGRGTGLGLATVYGIVKQNSGFVNVYSEPGKGTTFRIYLPALGADSIRNSAARNPDEPAVGGDETLLVVEDEEAILTLTRTMLERLGYTVLTAGAPLEATRLAQERSGGIDLVITDVVMPQMNGRDLVRNLQEHCPGIRSLFMSGYTANVIAHQGVLDEGVNFIQKPFSSRDLARKIREVLDSRPGA